MNALKNIPAPVGVMAVGLAAAPAADAALVTHNFAGSFFGQSGFANLVINFAGATITGSYTFDTAVVLVCSVATNCTYTDILTSLSGTVSYGGGWFSFTYGATNGNITIRNEPPGVPGPIRGLLRGACGRRRRGVRRWVSPIRNERLQPFHARRCQRTCNVVRPHEHDPARGSPVL